MKMNAEREIRAEPAKVWAALMDPKHLQQCVRGCTSMEGTVEDGFKAEVTEKVGPVKATLRCEIQVSDIDEGKSCTVSAHGKGIVGFAKGTAAVKLNETEEGTLLSYDVEGKLGGKLAQLGSRIVNSYARKSADRFFERLQESFDEDTSDR